MVGRGNKTLKDQSWMTMVAVVNFDIDLAKNDEAR
jgi:hypothetical protein